MIWEIKAEARRKLTREQGTIIKDWGGRIPVALVYANKYNVGMSNLGFQTVYGILNADDRTVCERAFWDGQLMDGSGNAVLSIESQRELSEFAVVAFSLTFELDYFNVVAILRQAKIPLLASERDERHPIVIAGGPCVIGNPEPIAPFFDALAIGEGEVIAPQLVDALSQGADLSRGDLLEKLANIPGVYVPSLYEVDYNADGTVARIAPKGGRRDIAFPVVRQHVRSLDEFPVRSVVLTPDTELGDMFLIEISRGCSRGCQFCLAGFVFLPVRERSLEQIVDLAREGLRFRKRIGLVGAATTDYSRMSELVTRLREIGAQVAISSLRLDSISDDLLKALVESGTKTITLAPEAGSERMRKLIKKRISEEQIFRAVDMLAKWKISRLKLYYMIGLPRETIEDVEAIVKLTLEMKERLEQKRAKVSIGLNVSPFVPKAQTPFQRESMMTVPEIEDRVRRVKRGLLPHKVQVRTESAEWSEAQGVLARGDRRLAGVLAAMERNTLSEWRRALAEAGLSADFYLRRPRPADEVLPWSVVRSGVRPGMPALEFRPIKSRALAQE